MVEKLKLKLKSRLKKRVMLKKTVEEKEPTSFRIKSLLVTKKPVKKKKKKNRKEKKRKEEIEEKKNKKKKQRKIIMIKVSPLVSPEGKSDLSFLKISTSNSFAVFGNLHQIE